MEIGGLPMSQTGSSVLTTGGSVSASILVSCATDAKDSRASSKPQIYSNIRSKYGIRAISNRRVDEMISKQYHNFNRTSKVAATGGPLLSLEAQDDQD